MCGLPRGQDYKPIRVLQKVVGLVITFCHGQTLEDGAN